MKDKRINDVVRGVPHWLPCKPGAHDNLMSLQSPGDGLEFEIVKDDAPTSGSNKIDEQELTRPPQLRDRLESARMYDAFINRVASTHQVWCLIPTCWVPYDLWSPPSLLEKQQSAMLFWSEQHLAREWRVGKWSACEIAIIPVHAFLDGWLRSLLAQTDEDFVVGTDWKPDAFGIGQEPSTVQHDLQTAIHATKTS
jgi:Protein of unknown function (DUF2750)